MFSRLRLVGLITVASILTGCPSNNQVILPGPGTIPQALFAGNAGCCLEIFSLPVTASSTAAVSVSLPGSPTADSAAFDAAGHVFVLDNGPTPPIVQEFNRPITGSSTPFATITLTGTSNCQYITTDSSGNLWVSCVTPATVYVIDGPFTQTGSYAKSASATLAGVGTSPRDLAFDASGHLFVAVSGSNVIQVWTSLSNASTPSGTLATSGGRGLAFDSAGNLYADNGTNLSLVRWNAPVPTTGAATAPDIVDAVANTGFTAPRGMTFDASGNLYVGECGSDLRVFALGSTPFSSSSTPSVVDTASGCVWDIDSAGS